MNIRSGTSGNLLPTTVLKMSRIRKIFGWPYILIEYIGTNRRGPVTRTMWCKLKDLV